MTNERFIIDRIDINIKTNNLLLARLHLLLRWWKFSGIVLFLPRFHFEKVTISDDGCGGGVV